jgi:glycosyltransferase involved in cell wall biosynthesis
VQNKVLEAMAMALPVVLSPEAATGIAARDGQHFAIGETDTALAQAALALLDDPARSEGMGKAARRFVVDELGWDAALAPLAGIVTGRNGSARHAA